jgi:MATE family, multidrug efflux pump
VERPSDRRILALAAPALGALAAEPLYLLVDTAVVGHLGRASLAGLAVGALILGEISWLAGFLAYGTTSIAARRFGGGRREDAVDAGVQATWLALAFGLLIVAVLEPAAGPLTGLIAGDNPGTQAAAEEWLQVAALGAPAITISLAGQGWMRGVQDTRRPLVYLLAANAASAAVSPLLVYPAGLGIRGSAIANVLAQTVAAGLFLRALVRERVPLAPRAAGIRTMLGPARDLMLRTLAFQVSFFAATAAASRMGQASVGAHQIAMQLWTFLALVLDSLAIAGQSLVGQLLGAGERDAARATARRLGELGLLLGTVFAVALAAGYDVIPRLFTDDAETIAQAHVAWPWFVAMQPAGGLLFALDGVLIGAGDVAFMRNVTIVGSLLGYLPLTLAAVHFDLGLGGIWAGLTLFIAIRTAAGVARTLGGRWAVVGASSYGD